MSPKKSVLLTLVDADLAEIGFEFISEDLDPDCRECNLIKVCSQLERNTAYRIKSIREKKHECKLIEGKVSIVEVEKADITRSITKDHAKGTAVESTWRDECNIIGCDYDHICFPPGVIAGKKYEIVSTAEEFTCPELGTPLVEAVVREVENN